ncbi:MAG: methyltransferase domain-containing protein [Desulfonauticus sp.]|nr:methyltransferase domain-containing protein [Desulfonauticus sp.]
MPYLNVAINSKIWTIKRPGDLETYWDKMDDTIDEDHIPYWLEVWPAAKLLAELIVVNPARFQRKIGLELGCGLGLVSMVAAEAGAKLLAIDLEKEALSFARVNSQSNMVSNICFANMDWNRPALKAKSVDFILASDVLYERRFFAPIVNFCYQVLKPCGFIWLSNPERNVSKEGISYFIQQGWQVKQIGENKISVSSNSSKTLVKVWEITT